MKIIKQITNISDSTLLQNDLNSFSTWCTKNFLDLNVSKCQSITYSRKRAATSPRSYVLSSEPIPFVNSLRDLGVICDSELNFHSHIDHIVNRANSVLGFVKRWSKEFSDPYVCKSLYIFFVRPLLEYACQVWSPSQSTLINRIESVQRRFVRFALRGLPWTDSFNLPPYESRLKLINLQPLALRRDVADITFVHQVLSGSIDCPEFLHSISLNTNPRNVRSFPTFRLESHRTNYGHFEPFTRMLRKANNTAAFDFHADKASLKHALYSPNPPS